MSRLLPVASESINKKKGKEEEPKKLNIALLTIGFHGDFKEATKITILTLAQELQRRGHHPIVISDKREETPEFEILHGIPVYRKAISKLFQPFFIFHHFFSQPLALKDVEKKENMQFDVIHNFSSAPLLALRGALARSLSGNKHCALVHTIKSRSKYKFGSTFLARFLNVADAITVHSTCIKDELQRYGAKAEKLHHIPSHIDLQQFVPMDKQHHRQHHPELGYTADDLVVFYYGPFTKRKGTEYLLQAIPLVWEKNPKIKFLLSCKKQQLSEEYEQLIAELGICKGEQAKNLYILFSPDHIPPYLNMTDLVVMPYPELIATESNPSCIIESMACKVPVITSNLPELKEIFASIPRLHDALFFEPKNPQAIAAKILLLADDASLRKKLADAGYRLAQGYDLRKVVSEYEGLYQRIMAKIKS